MKVYLAERRDGIAVTGSEAAVELVEASSPSRALLDIAGRIDADLIVLASRAHEGLERRILGSVASDMVQHGTTPVLIVPPLVIAPTAREPSLARILVPLDGSLLAEQALAIAARLLGSPADLSVGPARELALLYVADTQAALEDGRRYLQAVRTGLEAIPLPADVTLRTETVLGSPPGAIVATAAYGLPNVPAAPQPYDLLVMATHGRGGLSRWLFGSVAEYVLPRSSVPVLLVHPSQVDL
jgi:nucleotide-binding universal stress UspA family protein